MGAGSGKVSPAGPSVPRVGERTREIGLVVTMGLIVLIGAACGGDDGGDASATTGATAPTTTSTVTVSTTATTATTATTTGPPPTSPHQTLVDHDAQAYALAFISAWESGDRATAAVLAAPDVVAETFARDSGGTGNWSLDEPCGVTAGSAYCTFSAVDGRSLDMQVSNVNAFDGEVEAVYAVTFS